MVSRLFAAVLVFVPALLAAQDAAAPPENSPLARLVDRQTIAVLRVRFDKFEPEAVGKQWEKIAAAAGLGREEIARQIAALHLHRDRWAQAGAGDAFVLLNLRDLPLHGPFLAVPLKPGRAPDELIALLKQTDSNAAAEVVGNVLIFGSAATIARAAKGPPEPRPDLLAAVQSSAHAGTVVISLSDEQRRIYREVIPALPPPFARISGADLLAGTRSVVLTVDLAAAPVVNLTIANKDAATAEKWKELAQTAAAFLQAPERTGDEAAALAKLAQTLHPVVRGEQLELHWGPEERRMDILLNEVLAPLVVRARRAAGNTATMNDMKQLMLAMHIYHDKHKAFPAQAIRSKDGRKLLSWRVAVLPELGEERLYREFRLDEAWDSEHNRKLVAKMPAIFSAKGWDAATVKPGCTPYLVPVGEGTAFQGKSGVNLAAITDGTSNTIALVYAPPSAVEWTRPSDWEVDFAQPWKGWRAEADAENPGTLLPAGLFDGSVRALPAGLKNATLKHMLQISDGMVIDETN